MKRTIIILLLLGIINNAFAQLENPYIRRGNRQYKKQNYSQAEAQYRMALNKNPKSYPALFNLGLAFYKQDNDTEALKTYQKLVAVDTTAELKAKSYYNLGTIYTRLAGDSLQAQQMQGAVKMLQKAVEAFKTSVILNPGDYQARYNLWVTKKLLDSLMQQMQNQSQQNKNNQQNQQNKNNKDKNKNQQNQNKNNTGGKNQQQNQQNQKDSDGDGIPDKVEKQPNPQNPSQQPPDTDNDGKPDYLDQDSDNDGIPDRIEAGPNPEKPQDTDKDGIPDYRDTDSNNNGIPDSQEKTYGLSPQEIQRILAAIEQADKQTQQKAMKKLMNTKSRSRQTKPW